jgi:hypothetical protein
MEIDDAEAAVSEIKKQLEGAELKKNTVGIIVCHYEFVFAGVVAAVCGALPFAVLGTVASAQGANQVRDSLMLSILVLTSDEAEFSVSCSESLLQEPAAAVRKAYKAAAGERAEKPAFALMFAAFLPQNVGDEYVDAFTEASGGVPVFGTLSIDDTATFENAFMIYNGGHFRDKLGLILIYGDVHPKFYVASVSRSRVVLDRPALITDADRHILKEVNGRSLYEFFDELGLTKASETSYALTSIPFMIDYADGFPMGSKVFISLTPEKYGIFAGTMPIGATMYMGVFDKSDVILTTVAALKEAVADMEGKSAMIIYSCLSRYMSVGVETFAEMDAAAEAIGGKVPYIMAMSGGEVCPAVSDSGRTANRFHNNAFVCCVL